MEQILDQTEVAPKVLPEIDATMDITLLSDHFEQLAGQPITTDDSEPTDAERVLH